MVLAAVRTAARHSWTPTVNTPETTEGVIRLVRDQGTLADLPLRACILLRQNAAPPQLDGMWSEHRQQGLSVIVPLKQKHFQITVGDVREILRHGEALQILAAA